MTKHILISAGEASGDLHAANLVRELHLLDKSIKVTAMGGANLRAAGAQVIVDCAQLAVVGLIEVIRNYSTIKQALNTMSAWLTHHQPDLLILVDYQEFNIKLAKVAKQCGIKVLFYIGPQVWAWRPKRLKTIHQYVDMMAVLFPFEEALYQEHNVPVEFVGHPLVDTTYADKDKTTLLTEYDLQHQHQVVGLFPGSREDEIKRILPIQLETAQHLHSHDNTLQFVLAVAATLKLEPIQTYCDAYPHLNIKLIQDLPYNTMSVCDAIVSASGTATLEIGLMGIPLAITYRISPLSYTILKHMVKLDNIGLINIVAEKSLVKEFIQGQAQPQKISQELQRLLEDDKYRQTMINELKLIRAKLGKKGGSKNVAQLALSMLSESESESKT